MLARITAAEPIPEPLPALDTTDVTSRAASVLSAAKDAGLPPFEWVGQHDGEIVARADLPSFLSWALRLSDRKVTPADADGIAVKVTQADVRGIAVQVLAGGVVWNLSTESPTPVVEPVTEDLPVQAVVQAEIVPELGGAS
jgi:hypothetical protein